MIEVRALTTCFATDGPTSLPVLEDIELDVGDGEFVALVGPSGCGKTTLLNLIAGLERLAGDGAITVAGAPPAVGNPRVSYMLARDCLLPWRRAIDNAALALQLQGVPRTQRTDRARAALGTVGLEDFEASYPAQMSQGMRQRVALARVFATDPTLVLLDEPFSALDAQTRLDVQDAFLATWEHRRTTVMMVTHDLAEAVSLADRVVILSHRPATIKAIHRIDLPRPRRASTTREHPRFQQLFAATSADLRSEPAQGPAALPAVAHS